MIAEPLSTSLKDSFTLQALLSPWVDVDDAHERAVNGIQLDSRLVAAGDVFIAIAGGQTHGLDYLADVGARGACAVLVDTVDASDSRLSDVEVELPVYAVANLPRCAGEIIGRFYRDPSQSLQVVGVTGTDGKTSLCHLLGQALNESRNNCGVIGTLGIGFSDDLKSTGLTTPDCVTLQQALASFRDSDASYAAMEVSSHALTQGRVSGIAFDVAVLTNLGRDHLDYHGDMQSYRAAKESLFYLPELRAAVVNSDDDFGNSIIGRLADLELITFGSARQAGHHVHYSNISLDTSGLSFDLEFDDQRYAIKSGLVGDFNVANLSAIFAVLVALGISPELAADSVSQLQPVPGRMEVFRLDSGATAIVDYAHNPNALESALKSVASHVDGELVVVFGCGGDRDQGKRPLMAQVAERYSGRCIVTDDNPRNENGDDIVAQVMSGFRHSDKVVVERDRRKAIMDALGSAGQGDIVVIAGKGHEDYQLIGSRRIPFSDSSVIADFAQGCAS